MPESVVIIPTYNESENIARIIAAVLEQEHGFHVLVVDDGSPDGTGAIVKDLQPQYSQRLHIIERTGKLGLGTAYIAGFRWAMEHDYDYCFEMDADFSHSPQDLIRLLAPCRANVADVSVGSRYTKGGKVSNWPKDRLILSYGASIYTRMITWMPVKDPTAGFMCYRVDMLRKLDLDKIRFIGYAFQIEMKYALRRLGARIVEVPITFIDRQEGTSKMSGGIISEAVFGVLRMRLKSFSSSYGHDEQ